MENNNSPFENLSYFELLQGIINGSIDPKALPPEIRQALVQILVLRGKEHIQIAQMLKVSDRTIRRDLDVIWEENDLYRDPDFARRFAGELRVRVMSIVEMLTRITHSSDAKVQERVLAASKVIQSLKDLLTALQSLGFLPVDNCRKIHPDDAQAIKAKNEDIKQPSGHPLPIKEKPETNLTPLQRRDIRLRKKLELMPPMERERLRISLLKEIIKLSKDMDQDGDKGQEPPTDVPKPETPPKDDDEPGAGIGALAT